MKVFIEAEKWRVGPQLMEWLLNLGFQRTDTGRVKVIQGLNKQDATVYIIELEDGKTMDGETRVPVEKFLLQRHKIPLKSPALPLINVGSRKGTPPCYLPPEILIVLPGQPYRKKRSGVEKAMAEFGARPPAANAQRIISAAKSVLGLYPKRHLEVLPRLGVSLRPGIAGRILEAPRIAYAGQPVNPSPGHWNIREQKLSGEKRYRHWSFLSLAGSK